MTKEERREYNRNLYHRRKDNHQCVRCGDTDARTASGKTECATCAKYQKIMTQECNARNGYVVTVVRFDYRLLDAIDKVAEDRGVSRSQIILAAVERYMTM